jgi:hypothetical protein
MHSPARSLVIALLAVAGLQATAEAQSRSRPDRCRLTSEEIRAQPASSVHDLIKAKRANWLSVRGSASFETRASVDPWGGKSMTVPVEPVIVVYVDEIKLGSAEILRSMSTEDVESIERLDAASATQRFGTGHDHGAILIKRRSR